MSAKPLASGVFTAPGRTRSACIDLSMYFKSMSSASVKPVQNSRFIKRNKTKKL